MLTSTQLATGGLMYTQEEGEAFVDRLVREAANDIGSTLRRRP